MKDEKEGLMSKITEGGLSRRQFLTGSALTAGAVASLGLAGCAQKRRRRHPRPARAI